VYTPLNLQRTKKFLRRTKKLGANLFGTLSRELYAGTDAATDAARNPLLERSFLVCPPTWIRCRYVGGEGVDIRMHRIVTMP
jgi:hypothetical protein